jgi:hypothetical protein
MASIREHIDLVESVHGNATPKVIRLVFREDGSGSDGLILTGVPVQLIDGGRSLKLFLISSTFEDGSEEYDYAEKAGQIVMIGGELSQWYVIP